MRTISINDHRSRLSRGPFVLRGDLSRRLIFIRTTSVHNLHTPSVYDACVRHVVGSRVIAVVIPAIVRRSGDERYLWAAQERINYTNSARALQRPWTTGFSTEINVPGRGKKCYNYIQTTSAFFAANFAPRDTPRETIGRFELT